MMIRFWTACISQPCWYGAPAGHHSIPEPAPHAYTLTPTQLTSLVALGSCQSPLDGCVALVSQYTLCSFRGGGGPPQSGLQSSAVLLSIWGGPGPLGTITAAQAWLLRGPETPPSPAWPALPAQQPCWDTPFSRPHPSLSWILGSASFPVLVSRAHRSSL